MLTTMSKRTREPGPVPVTDDQVLLFDVPAPEKPAEERKTARCSECGAVLRARRSVDAGVSERCAAKVGRAVLETVRVTRKSRVDAVAEAV